MKRIGIIAVILALMLFLVSAVSADTIFTDNFESGLTWTTETPGNSNVSNAETTAHEAHAGTGAAFMYGDSSDYETVAIKKQLDLTDYENIAIGFYWAVESFDDTTEIARFEVSTDGTSWTTIETLFTGPSGDTNDHTTTSSNYATNTVTDLSAHDGESILWIRFSAYLKTGDPTTPGDLFMIDDVTVTGDLVVSNNPPTITSTPVTDAVEDQLYTYDVNAEDLDDDTLIYSLTTKPDGMTMVSSTGVITWTPDYTQIGNNNVVVKVSDGIDFDTQSFTIEVEEVNDAPVLTVSGCTSTDLIEDEQYTCTVTAEDEEDDDLTFSLVEDKYPEGMTIDDESGVIIWEPNDEQIGSHKITVKVEETTSPENYDEKQFTDLVRPYDICGTDTVESGLKITVDITDYADDFYPGDKIEIEVNVENKKTDEEIENIVVEAILYDVTDGKTIDTAKTDDFDLDKKEDEVVELILEIPQDIDVSNDFIVFISASGDGDDDEYCDWGYNDDDKNDLEIKRRNHDVAIEKVLVTPSTVEAGKSVEVRIDVENVGARDEKDVYVKIKNGDLGIDKKSDLFEVKEYEKGDDDEYSVTITFTVPEDTIEGNYDLEIYVYDDENEVYESGHEFVTLFVQGTATQTTTETETGAVTITTEGAPEEVEQGKSFTIPVKLTNTADETKEYKITISNIGDWAKSTSEFDAYLEAGQSSTYYITVTPNEDAAEGKHSATINVKEGTTTIATKTLSFTIPGTTSVVTGGTVLDIETEDKGFKMLSGTTLWVIADIILVVVAIFFIKMLFSKRS